MSPSKLTVSVSTSVSFHALSERERWKHFCGLVHTSDKIGEWTFRFFFPFPPPPPFFSLSIWSNGNNTMTSKTREWNRVFWKGSGETKRRQNLLVLKFIAPAHVQTPSIHVPFLRIIVGGRALVGPFSPFCRLPLRDDVPALLWEDIR